MAQFENVNYTYYNETLGRAVIPDADTFNKYKLENVQYIKTILPYLEERETNGIDNAACLCIEADYKLDRLKSGASPEAVASESLGGHSINYGSQQLSQQVAADTKSADVIKMELIKLFCFVNIGVK